MPLIKWNDNCCIGVREIDEQHMELVGIINKLFEEMKAGKGAEAMGDLLNNLVEYTMYHFSTEDRHMTATDYPRFVEQKEDHDMFTKQVVALQRSFLEGDTLVTIETLKFLQDWFSNHLLKEDKELGSYLNGKGVV